MDRKNSRFVDLLSNVLSIASGTDHAAVEEILAQGPLNQARRLLDQVQTQSFDWMFDFGATRPFLNHLIHPIHGIKEEMIVPILDLQLYDQISKEGPLLDRDQLLSSIEKLKKINQPSGEVDALISSTEEEIRQMQEQLDRLQSGEKQLLRQTDKLQQAIRRVEASNSVNSSCSTSAKQYQHTRNEIFSMNDELNSKIDQLATVLSSIIHVFSVEDQVGEDVQQIEREENSGLRSPDDQPFAFQHSLEAFFRLDDQFINQIRSFIQKQLEQDPTEKFSFEDDSDQDSGCEVEDREIAFLNMRSRFSILNMMHPKYLLVRGENQEQHIRTCSEIARLQQMSGLLVYPQSELKKLDAEMAAARLSAQLDTLKVQLLRKPYYMQMDINSIQEKIEKTRLSICKTEASIVQSLQSGILPILQDLAELQAIDVLEEDFGLKIVRQKRFLQKQATVLECLLEQFHRHQLLSLLFKKEQEELVDVLASFSAINEELKQQITDQQVRELQMEKLSQVEENPLPLGVDPAKEVEAIAVENDLKRKGLLQLSDQSLESVEKVVNQLDATLHATLNDGCSQEFRSSLADLEAKVQQLNSEMESIMRERTEKLSQLQASLVMEERNFFVNFLLNQPEAEKMVNELEKLVEVKKFQQQQQRPLS